MVIAHTKRISDDSPLIVGIGDYTDPQFNDSVWGYRDLIEAGLNASLPKSYRGLEVFHVSHGNGGRVEYRLTEEGQAAIIRTAIAANDTEAIFRVTGVLETSRKYAKLITLMGEAMFLDGEVLSGIGTMSVQPFPRGHNRWDEEAAYAEAMGDLTVGHYYRVTLAGPRREYVAKLNMGQNKTAMPVLVAVKFKSISNRDGLVICAQDMDTEAVPTPEGERNSVTGDKYSPISGNRFFRAVDGRALDRFQANWDLIMGSDEPQVPAEETPDFNADSDTDGEEATW